MTPENVDVVRQLFDAFAHGDAEAIVRLHHPNATWTPLIAPMLGVEEIRGHEAVRRFLTQDLGFDSLAAEPLSFQHQGNKVIAAVHLTARVKASGLQIDDTSAFVYTLRDGKVAAVREYDTEAEALEAAGAARVGTVAGTNVEIARRHFELFNRRELASWLEQFDPGVAFHTSADNPDPGTYHGRQGVAELAAAWFEMFDVLRIEPEEFIDAGDYLIVPARVRGRGTESGAEIDMPRTWTSKWRNGKVVEVWEHRTKQDALEAAGLQK